MNCVTMATRLVESVHVFLKFFKTRLSPPHDNKDNEMNVHFGVLYSCQASEAVVCVTGCSRGATTNEPAGREADN